MYHTLEIPELLEAIFAFLSRKDLYRSCTRVNSQWNAISRYVIQKKRKSEFINIPSIHNNILFHLFDSCNNFNELKEYYGVCKLWNKSLEYLYDKKYYFNYLASYEWLIKDGHITRERFFRQTKKGLINCIEKYLPQDLKHDSELNKYYQYILSQYEIRGEFRRLTKAFHSYDYMPNITDEFCRQSKVLRSINYY